MAVSLKIQVYWVAMLITGPHGLTFRRLEFSAILLSTTGIYSVKVVRPSKTGVTKTKYQHVLACRRSNGKWQEMLS
jgi:hypothetical protein